MKKTITLMFSIIVMLFLVACGNDDPEVSNGAAPVYQGMIISTNNDQVLKTTTLSTFSPKQMNDVFEMSVNDLIEEDVDVNPGETLAYYAGLNEDVFITVKLVNPDSQVILRFTLNDTIYQSFQFQEGSDSENLILKVNSGDVPGIKEFTIDEIKYIENGTNVTKDAVIDGNQTVQLGVTYDVMPSATISDLVVGSTSMSATVNVADPSRLIEQFGNIIKFYITNESSIITSFELELGINNIEYDKLLTDMSYEYAVMSVFDAFDGEGNRVNILSQSELKTTPIIAIDSITTTKTSASFELDVNDENNAGSITAIELYLEDELVQTASDVNSRSFDNLLSNTDYEIKVSFEYDLNDGEGKRTHKITTSTTTFSKMSPIISVINILATQDAVSFDLDIEDEDNVGQVESISLYQNDILINSLEDLSVREFTGLLSNNEYLIEVIYTYDLNDGQGPKEKIGTIINPDALTVKEVIDNNEEGSFLIYGTVIEIIESEFNSFVIESGGMSILVYQFTDYTPSIGEVVVGTYFFEYDSIHGGSDIETLNTVIRTLEKAIPNVSIINITPTQDSISFELDITDIDNVGQITAIELYQGETLVDSLDDLSLRVFEDLLSNNEYEIKITYEYDLNDGKGSQTTTGLIIPDEALSVKEVIEDNEAGEFLIYGTVIEIENNNFVIESGGMSILVYQNTNYRPSIGEVVVGTYSFEYDSIHGGIDLETLNTVIRTLEKAIPNVSIINITPTQDSISFELDITDVDNVGTITAIELYQGETLVDSLDDLSLRVFEGLLSNNEYEIKVTYEYDLNDGFGEQSLVFYSNYSEITLTTFTYSDIPSDFWQKNIQLKINDFDESQETATFQFIGVAGQEYMFKVEGNGIFEETVFIATGSLQNATLDLSEFTEAERDSIKLAIVFVRTLNATGTIELYGPKEAISYEPWVAYGMDLGVSNEAIIIEPIVTLTKATPIVSIVNISATQDSISFELDITDIDDVGQITAIELYQGETLVKSLDDMSLRTFDNLLSDTDYEIKVTYEYDLNDGEGNQILVVSSTGANYLNGEYVFNPTAYDDALALIVFEGKMYAIYTGRDIFWTDAVNLSIEKGGYLMTVNSDEELLVAQELLNYTQNFNTWYGGYFENGEWKWITGEVFEFVPEHFYYPSTIDPSEGDVLKSWFDSADYWYIYPDVEGLIAYIVEIETGGVRLDRLTRTEKTISE